MRYVELKTDARLGLAGLLRRRGSPKGSEAVARFVQAGVSERSRPSSAMTSASPRVSNTADCHRHSCPRSVAKYWPSGHSGTVLALYTYK